MIDDSVSNDVTESYLLKNFSGVDLMVLFVKESEIKQFFLINFIFRLISLIQRTYFLIMKVFVSIICSKNASFYLNIFIILILHLSKSYSEIFVLI